MKQENFQVVCFPYLGLTGSHELRFGKLAVWSANLLQEKIGEGAVRARVQALLESHRAPSGRSDKSTPLQGIGVVSRRGTPLFGYLVPQTTGEIQELRYALFLACLSDNLAMHGPNAARWMYTAENFSFISQGFSLSSPYFSESTGVLVRFHNMGYRIGEIQFPTPSYVPRPSPFRYDETLFAALNRARRLSRKLFRRIMDATALFLESYYNTHSVDMRARILLQAASFEVLLDLPSSQQRRAFKDEIERYCAEASERRYRYKFEIHGGSREEKRSSKGIWADRFYTLRNHIIHGDRVSPSEYVFRGSQHHVQIAPIFFVHVVKKLLEAALPATGKNLKFYSVIDWHRARRVSSDVEDHEEESSGFRTRKDLHAYFLDKLTAAGL